MRQKMEPKINADDSDIDARTLLVGPSRVACTHF